MIIKRSFLQKLLFKLVRLPIPWVIRRAINRVVSFLSFSFSKSEEIDELKILINKGSYVTSVEKFGLHINFNELLTKAKTQPLFDQWDRANAGFFFNDVPNGVNTAVVIMDEELERITAAIGEQLRHSDIVKSYFNGVPKISNKSIWWSFPGNKEREAQLWHRDIDNIFFLKCFVYLTDVGADSAPHFFIEGSHRSLKNLMFKRFSNEELISQGFDVPLIGTTGEKGTMIFEDTFGLHRGSSPTNNKKRCILQYQFSLFKNP